MRDRDQIGARTAPRLRTIAGSGSARAVRAAGWAAGTLAVLAATPALAAEGMPQLDFGNPLTIAQIVWLGVIFTVLYVLLSNWALPKVASVLEMRASTIAADLDAARQAKDRADAAVAEVTKATREAQAVAQDQISVAVAQAKAAAAQDADALNARLEAQIRAAEDNIAAARTQAMGALAEVATSTAREIVNRLTGGAVPEQAVDDSVRRALDARAARA